jgi:hypothetical protein
VLDRRRDMFELEGELPQVCRISGRRVLSNSLYSALEVVYGVTFEKSEPESVEAQAVDTNVIFDKKQKLSAV